MYQFFPTIFASKSAALVFVFGYQDNERSVVLSAASLIIGTAQFGMAYGATNNRGQVTETEAIGIIARAYASGVRAIDTAAAYGASEELLGRYLREFPDISVITKSVAVETKEITVNEVRAFRVGFEQSLERLRRQNVHGFLVHRAEDLFKDGNYRLVEFLTEIKREGLAMRIGVSVYDADELDRVLEVFQPDIIQMPINIFDQRLFQKGYLAKLKKLGIEVHARSAFLQGLLLASPGSLDPYFSRFKSEFSRYDHFIKKHALTKLVACLGLVLKQAKADRVVVGLTSQTELDDVLDALQQMPESLPDMESLSLNDGYLIDPRMWPAFR